MVRCAPNVRAGRCTPPHTPVKCWRCVPSPPQVDDDEFASTVVCAILQKFDAIPTCAADFESAVNRWDEQQDDQRLDVVGACLALPCPRPCFRSGETLTLP